MGQLQESRQVEITTPLGDDVLLFHRMTATEELGRLFRFEVDLLSRESDINFADILGQNVTVRLALPGDQHRYFNGFISRFTQEGYFDEYYSYTATLHPWLWFLTRTADCRMFQGKTVPDIVKSVFKDHGFSDYEESLSGNYRTWEYCVQYRETDFNFVSRLMEQEGIYYYFKHENNKHIMVLSDGVSSHECYPGYEELPYFPPDEHLSRERDHIHDWTLTQAVQPGVYALNDFNFTQPKSNMQVKSIIQRDYAHAGMEIYDFPGEYPETANGESYVRTRIEELQVEHEQIHAQGNARGLAVGTLFKLTQYPREDQNREYLVVSATHHLESGPRASGDSGGSDEVYTCSFSAMNSKEPFRPARTTPKPMVQGPQTAIVVGPSGDEIHTDQYGRVKVSFHWDRYSKSNETSSCWVRVSQAWAGKQWGAIHIPRIGQEVIVEFLEGDPDHPIITGRVYNNDNMPPYELPANGTQSGIKSHSSKGGSPDNFNEIRFEDKKGEEEIYLHGEKNWTIKIENDKNQTIDHDESLSVGNNRTKSVGKDQSESIGANKSISVGKNHSESIGDNATIDVGKNESVSIGKNDSISIGENLTLSVGKNSSESIGENLSRSIGKDMSSDIGNNLTQNIAKKSTTQVGDDMGLSVGKKLNIKADDQINIISDKQITLKSGDATIVLKKNGDITIKGKNINIKGSGDINMKASKIKEN